MYHPCLDDCLHTVRHWLPQSLELLGRNFLPTEGKNFRQFFLHPLRATRIVANPGVIDVQLLFEKNPGVLNWIEVRGVRRVGLKRNVILLEGGGHGLCSMYASIFSMK